MIDVPEQSKKILRKLEEISDWNDGDLNVWSFEQSVIDLYNHYKGKLSDDKLYYACTGLVHRIGGAGVRDPVILYLELLRSGETDKEKFTEQFKNRKEGYKKVYDDFPNDLDEEFFDYCFHNLKKAGLIEIDNGKVKTKNMFDLDLDSLIGEGKAESEAFNTYMNSEEFSRNS